ncbi:MAG: hypothetical protein CM15mP120_09620 [Pseudomonadota bacterium]|nr:MAG: hypothetical protein CM15mP120_09620 [Pseudomonadota bacterium]
MYPCFDSWTQIDGFASAKLNIGCSGFRYDLLGLIVDHRELGWPYAGGGENTRFGLLGRTDLREKIPKKPDASTCQRSGQANRDQCPLILMLNAPTLLATA